MRIHPNGVSFDISFLFTKKVLFLTTFVAMIAGGAYFYLALQKKEEKPLATPDNFSGKSDDGSTVHSHLAESHQTIHDDGVERSPRSPALEKMGTPTFQNADGVAEQPTAFVMVNDDAAASQERLTEDNLRLHAEELAAKGVTEKGLPLSINKVSSTESAFVNVDDLVIAEAQEKIVPVVNAAASTASGDTHTRYDFAHNSDVASDKPTATKKSPTRPGCALFQAATPQPTVPKKPPFAYLSPSTWW